MKTWCSLCIPLPFSYEYQVKEQAVNVTQTSVVDIFLEDLSEQLSEVEIIARKRKVFELSRLRDVEETAIYAGKKSQGTTVIKDIVKEQMAQMLPEHKVFAHKIGDLSQIPDVGTMRALSSIDV